MAAHNSLISEIRKNFLYKVGRSTLKLDESQTLNLRKLSYVGGLTTKGQVGVLLWEHRGWMLHIAFSYTAKYCVQQHAFLYPHKEESTIHRRASVPLSLQKGASFCKHSFRATFPSCPFNVYENIFRFTPTLLEDCTVPRIRSGFLLSKDKVLSLLATSLLNRNPYGFPINGSPVF